MRIDKWLWCVRVYKTRTLAADAVKMNRVSVGGAWIKPSHEVRPGEEIDVRKGPVTFSFRVLGAKDAPGTPGTKDAQGDPGASGAKGLPSGRLPAAQVALYAENITPRSELDKLNVPRETLFISRDRGTGRPTKKDRREIDSLMGDFFAEELDD